MKSRGKTPGRWGRFGRVVGVADALPPSIEARRVTHSWGALVGATLAPVTVLVGLSEDGAIRVMAANEAARREVEARAAHILASWNTVAAGLHARRAERVECWVKRDLVVPPDQLADTPAARPRRPAPPPPEPTESQRAEAAAAVAAVADDDVREALSRARAKWIARRKWHNDPNRE